jgi:hypothetical protein
MIRQIDNFLLQCSRNAIQASLITGAIGAALALASYFVVHVGLVTFHGQLADGRMVTPYNVDKQVGYLAALNWSLFGTLFFPMIVAFSLRLRGTMEEGLHALADLKMARTPAMEPLTPQQFLDRWRLDRRRTLYTPFVIASIGMVAVVLSWWSSVADPVLHGIADDSLLNIKADSLEYDWSIACILRTGHHISCASEFAFGAIAFLLIPCVVTGLAFWTMVDAFLFVAFACGKTPSAAALDNDGEPLPTNWTLVASASDGDERRCGFEAFEGFFSALLFNAFFILLSLFLIFTQNSFLRDPDSKNILSFLGDDFQSMVDTVVHPEKFSNLQNFVFSITHSTKGINLENPKTIYGLLAFLFVVVICFTGILLLLRSAANKSRRTALLKKALLAEELGIEPAVVEQRLARMKYWPLGWMTLNTAVLILTFMCFSLFSFRLAVMPVAIALIWTAWKMALLLRRLMPWTTTDGPTSHHSPNAEQAPRDSVI